MNYVNPNRSDRPYFYPETPNAFASTSSQIFDEYVVDEAAESPPAMPPTPGLKRTSQRTMQLPPTTPSPPILCEYLTTPKGIQWNIADAPANSRLDTSFSPNPAWRSHATTNPAVLQMDIRSPLWQGTITVFPNYSPFVTLSDLLTGIWKAARKLGTEGGGSGDGGLGLGLGSGVGDGGFGSMSEAGDPTSIADIGAGGRVQVAAASRQRFKRKVVGWRWVSLTEVPGERDVWFLSVE